MIWKDTELHKLETTHLLNVNKLILFNLLDKPEATTRTLFYYGNTALDILHETNRIISGRAKKIEQARKIAEKKELNNTCPVRTITSNRHLHPFFVQELLIA